MGCIAQVSDRSGVTSKESGGERYGRPVEGYDEIFLDTFWKCPRLMETHAVFVPTHATVSKTRRQSGNTSRRRTLSCHGEHGL